MKGFFVPNTKERLPLIGLGTYGIERIDQPVSFLKKVISLGYTLIDTAENYGKGRSEEIIGRAIKDTPRKDLFMISKVSPNHLRYKDVIKSAVESVKRLGTFIDLYMIHVPNSHIPLEETFSAMEKLKQRHIIRYSGVSNFEYEDLKKAISFGIKANEHEYSLIYRHYEKEVKLCHTNNILFLSYRPLSHGELLEEKYKKLFLPFEKKYKKTAAQIALRWLIQKGTIPIVGSKNIEHLKENLDVDWQMEKSDMGKLGQLFKD
jgi:diketogulonate reductase-like aldo/keto reductase